MVHLCYQLESTDAAGRVPHPSPTRPDVGHGVQHGCLRVGATSKLFFFSRIRADAAQFASNRVDLARIRSYRPYRVISAISNRIGRRPIRPIRLKQAKIGLESRRNSRNSDLRGIVMCFLPSSFFVL